MDPPRHQQLKSPPAQTLTTRACAYGETKLQAVAYLSKELLLPAIQVLKCLYLCHIVHQNTTVPSPVERGSESLEPFLPCCVPYLHRE